MKVLLVDDETVQLRGLSEHIDWEKYGYAKPDTAGTGKAALLKMKDVSYDLVITDVAMPEMTGLEMIKKSREILDKLPCFVILSGYSDFEYAQQAIQYGVRFYVLKPIKTEEIEEILKTIWMERKGNLNVSEKEIILLPERVHPVIFQVLQIINKEFMNNINIQDLSERLSINSSYLSTLFKKEMNMNFSCYLSKVRVYKGLEYLKEGNYKISEIAEMVGYQTSAYFSELFKKEFGCNPKDYRF